MVVKEIGEYLEKSFGITEFWYRDKRYVKTCDGTWINIK